MQPSSLFKNRIQQDVYQTGRLRRSTLVSLRWMAITGQLITIILAYSLLRFDFPLLPVLAVIAMSVFFNIVLLAFAPMDRRISFLEAGGQLFFDIVQLSTLLYLTGGMENPFVILLMAPVIVAAKTLDKRIFVLLAGAVGVFSFLLLHFHLSLPWHGSNTPVLPNLYQYGLWVALLVGMLFTSAYTWRATKQTRRMTEALAITDAILAHETKLSALGGLAAAAAHKLGTPLSTIQLVAKEIANAAKPDSDLAEDAHLLIAQAKVCRDILKELAARGDKGDLIHDQLSLRELVREITEPFEGFGKEIIIEMRPEVAGTPMPILARRAEFVYGLTNIVENAVDFAAQTVKVCCVWTETNISLEVLDDGPGFATAVLDRVGEPYISYRPDTGTQTGGGMGLGVFIATTMVERVGGSIRFSNREDASGAHIRMCWPLENPERSGRISRPPGGTGPQK